MANVLPNGEIKVYILYNVLYCIKLEQTIQLYDRHYKQVTTSFFSVNQLISTEMTLRGEESTHFQF